MCGAVVAPEVPMRWPLVLLAYAAIGCAVEDEKIEENGSGLGEGGLWVDSIKRVASIPSEAEAARVLGLGIGGTLSIRSDADAPMPLYSGCTDGECLSLVDAKTLTVRDASPLDVAVVDRGALEPELKASPDGRWSAFRGNDGMLRVAHADDEPAWAWNLGEAPEMFRWLGRDLLVLETGTHLRVFDVKTRKLRVERKMPAELVATPSGDHVLAFTPTEAQLVRVSDGRTTDVTGWRGFATVIPSPTGDRFAVVRESEVALLGLDGTLRVLEPSKRPEIAFAHDGALAYLRPVAGSTEDFSVVIQRPNTEDVVLDGARGPEGGLRFSDDGKRIAVARGRFLGRTDKSGPLKPLAGDPTSEVGQVSFASSLDRAFVQLHPKGAPEQPGRLERIDMESGVASKLMAVEKLPGNVGEFFWITSERDGTDPTLYVRMNGIRRLVAGSGSVRCLLPATGREIGWANGVFYFVEDIKEGEVVRHQLRGVSRDCKVAARIGAPADEMIVDIGADRSEGFRETELRSALFRVGREVFGFLPPHYVAQAVPAESAASAPKEEEAAPTNVLREERADVVPVEITAAPRSSKRANESGCAAAPRGARDGLGALALTLFVALGRRKRRHGH
jgi:hypothetical protein